MRPVGSVRVHGRGRRTDPPRRLLPVNAGDPRAGDPRPPIRGLPERPVMAVCAVSGLALDARDRRRADPSAAGCAPAGADPLESVDPAVEAARFAGEDVWIAERVGEQRASLIRGDEAYREVMGVAPAQRPELLLGPRDRDPHQFRECEAGAAGAFVQLRAEAAMRATVQRDDLTLICVGADEGLQSALW